MSLLPPIPTNFRAATALPPLIKLDRPQSGRYEIWVGTVVKGKTPKAKLLVTEVP